MKKLMTFREYSDFAKIASKTDYKENITYFDPSSGWVLSNRKFSTLQEMYK